MRVVLKISGDQSQCGKNKFQIYPRHLWWWKFSVLLLRTVYTDKFTTSKNMVLKTGSVLYKYHPSTYLLCKLPLLYYVDFKRRTAYETTVLWLLALTRHLKDNKLLKMRSMLKDASSYQLLLHNSNSRWKNKIQPLSQWPQHWAAAAANP